MATIVAPFIISGLLSGYHELMYVGLLIAAAKDIPIDRNFKRLPNGMYTAFY